MSFQDTLRSSLTPVGPAADGQTPPDSPAPSGTPLPLVHWGRVLCWCRGGGTGLKSLNLCEWSCKRSNPLCMALYSLHSSLFLVTAAVTLFYPPLRGVLWGSGRPSILCTDPWPIWV